MARVVVALPDRAARWLDRQALELVKAQPDLSLLQARGKIAVALLKARQPKKARR